MNRKLAIAMILTIALIGVLVVVPNVQKVEASGTIYIRADGSIDPLTANITSVDNVTYTFTANINESIRVERINIILDGNGYTLNGTGTGQYAGITIEYVDPYADDNVTIQNVNIVGFYVGIGLVSTEGNKIFGCTITNTTNGIQFAEAMNNTISENTLTNNTNGVSSNTLMYTTFSENIISNNTNGIWFEFSSDNIVYENNITNNERGIALMGMGAYNNTFYHNYFIDNTNQTHIDIQDTPNIWDDGYPSGGNYWSDFEERYPGVGDIYQGPGQNETGSDGIWDGPYEMDEGNIDHYPLVPEFPAWTSMLLILMALTVAIAIYKRKLTKTSIH